MTGTNKLIFGLAPICILLMILFSTPGFALYNHTTENSIISQDGTSCAITDLTKGNDTDWSTFAYCTCGGTPCSSVKLYENYTYNSDWNRSDTTMLYVTLKYGMNHTYGTTKLYVWNYTKNDWSTPINYANGIGNVTVTAQLPKNNFVNGTNPIQTYFVSSQSTNSINYFFSTKVLWSGDPYVTNCSSGYGSPYLTYTCKNELTSSNVVCDLDTSILIGSANQSFQFRNNYTYQVCIDPNNTAYVLNATSKYSNTSYSTRYHFLENANVSSNQNITLYLLNSSESTLIAMIIKDQVENPVENEIVLAQKQDLGTGTYTQVAEAKSDFSGYAYTYLKMHEIYKFFLIKNGIVQREFEPMQLESTTLTFYVSQIDTPEYFSYYNNVATSCTNVSNNLTCSWIDTSGLTADMNLYVGRIDQAGETTFCDYIDSSSSGTFVCDLSSGGNFRYVLKGTYHSNPITYVWQSGYIGGSSVVDFGVVGLVLTLLIVMFVAYMTHNDVKICLISTAFALIFCSVISLIRFGADAMAMTFTVGIISGIVAFKIRF